MNFTNIPKNGASWNDELLYSFATELADVADVELIVHNADTNTELGRLKLYGVSEATVDIAPIIRRAVSMTPPEALALKIAESPSVCRVQVECERVLTPARTFFRAEFSASEPEMLSSLSTVDGIASGESIRLTLAAYKMVQVDVELWGGGELLHRDRRSITSANTPREVVIPIGELASEVDNVVVGIVNNTQSDRWVFPVVERLATSRRLIWYNSRGGVECYTFPLAQSIRRSAEVLSTIYAGGRECRLKSAHSVVRLTSTLLSRAEQERLAEIIRSPYIFEECDGSIHPVELAERVVTYDDHGTAQRLSISIVEEWKGGAR